MTHIFLILTIQLLNIIDAYLTWKDGQTTERNPVFRFAIKTGVWGFIGIKTAFIELMCLTSFLFWKFSPEIELKAICYGIAIGITFFVLMLNIFYLKKRGKIK